MTDNRQNPPEPRSTPNGVDGVQASASTALETTQSGALDAARRTANAIDANPLPVLVGGLALGALVAAMLPRSVREGQLLRPLGKRLTDTASAAARAARDAGKSELDTLGLNRNAARDQVGKIVEGVVKALTSAGSAAVSAAKTKP